MARRRRSALLLVAFMCPSLGAPPATSAPSLLLPWSGPPRPVLPSLGPIDSSALHASSTALHASERPEDSSWSTGAKDLAPLTILIEYWMMGNPLIGTESTWVTFFLLLAGLFMTLNILQDDKSRNP